jgi:hypothetical protein
VKELARQRIAAVWLGLVVATLVSWRLGADHSSSGDAGRAAATTGVLVLAFGKVRFVGLDFMELRRAPLALRLIFEAWVLIVLTTLVVLYLTSR